MGMFDRRQILGGGLAVCASALAGCASGAGRGGGGTTALLNADGTPTREALMKPGPLGEKALGNPDAPVTIIEYASLTCPFCRRFHLATYPRLKKELIDTGKVYYIIREFPIGRSAAAAAVVTRCAPAKDYFTLYDKFLTQQKKWTGQKVRPDAIYKVAAQTGMSRAAFDSCMANQEIIDGLVWVKQRGRQFGVSGTPTFFINGKKARGALTFDQIKAMIGPQVS
ncbi:MAG: DsbA family protein [Methyloligellaceae bacterium]